MTTYRVRGDVIWLNYHVDGKRIRKSTKLKNTPQNIKIVKTKIIPALDVKIATGEIYKTKPKTFKYYGTIFLKLKDGNKSYFLKQGYWRRVIDHFGTQNIDTITRLDIKEYLNSLNMMSKSKNSYKSCIRQVFELAVDDGVISHNPALSIRLKPDPRADVEHYSKEEVHRLLEVTTGVMSTYLIVAFNTGLRSGEILGLQLNDFKDDGLIHIQRTRSKGVLGSGKTDNAIRKVPYANFLLEAVKAIQPKDSFFIFGDIDDSMRLRYDWKRAVTAAKVPSFRLYATRHTFATIMLQDKIVSVNELAGLLGHSNPKITLEHYASIINAKDINLGENFALFGHVSVTTEKTKVV